MTSAMKAYTFVLWITLLILTECNGQTLQNFTLGNKVYEVEALKENSSSYSQCYIDVVVHNSSSYKYGLEDAVVTALSGALKSDTLKFSQAKTGSSGHVCLPIVCHNEVRVFVEKNNVRIPAFNKTMQYRYLPLGYVASLDYNNEVIEIYAFAWGNLGGKNGPVYSNRFKNKCVGATLNNYYLVFSYVTFPDRLYATFPPPTNPKDPNATYAWRYNGQKKTCYLKIGFKVKSTSVKISTYSIESVKGGKQLGIFETGPLYDVNAKDTTDKAACIEFRCPAIDDDSGDDLDTFIKGNITVPGKNASNPCKVENKNTNIFTVSPTSFETKYPLNSGDNYGSSRGIYTNENPTIARAKCFTGREYLGSEYAMNVSTGTAFSYDCTSATVSIVTTGLGK